MDDLEETLNYSYHLVDSWKAQFQHLITIVSSLLIFPFYGVFLWLLCSLTPGVIPSLLLLGTQLGLGIPMTRAYYDFGITTSNSLTLFDSDVHEDDQDIIDHRISVGDIPLLFERMELQVQKYDAGKFDDLNDLSWFLVIVWAIISSGAHYLGFLGQLLSIFGVIILLGACIMCYASGYWTKRGFSFEEDLDHLEFYIDSFVKVLDATLPAINGTFVLQVKHRRRSYALVDFATEFILGDSITLEYHFGLSSSLKERFVMEAPDAVIAATYDTLRKVESIFDAGWELEQVNTLSGVIIRIVNPHSKLSISDRSSFVTSPSLIEHNTKLLRDILSNIVYAIKGILPETQDM